MFAPRMSCVDFSSIDSGFSVLLKFRCMLLRPVIVTSAWTASPGQSDAAFIEQVCPRLARLRLFPSYMFEIPLSVLEGSAAAPLAPLCYSAYDVLRHVNPFRKYCISLRWLLASAPIVII